MSEDERIQISDLCQAGMSMRQVARELGRAPSTISRELRREVATGRRGYRPFEAHRDATARRAQEHGQRVETNLELGRVVAERLSQRSSPVQISRHLRRVYPHDRQMWLCPESIDQATYQPGSTLMRPTPLAPRRRSRLRTGREHRRALQRRNRRRPRFEQPMLTIHQRPFAPEDRSQHGHWEGDVIIGKNRGSAIGTLAERQTRVVRLLHLPRRDGE